MMFSRTLTWAAVGFVALSVANLAILVHVGGPERLFVSGMRVALSGVVAFYLARGRRWARWLTVALAIVWAFGSVLGFLTLLPRAERMPFWFLYWGLVMAAGYVALASYLVASRRVSAEWRPAK
jgi:hypothetical protein